ncbi:hypothetical protein CASFOL_028717 [Castilleja foliolosa]|uniref:Uncharacterized protein n=1 Tax=Castilleja foliolosa TaxID=1961234 RepID=A0ABD3CDI3_9LAMI
MADGSSGYGLSDLVENTAGIKNGDWGFRRWFGLAALAASRLEAAGDMTGFDFQAVGSSRCEGFDRLKVLQRGRFYRVKSFDE